MGSRLVKKNGSKIPMIPPRKPTNSRKFAIRSVVGGIFIGEKRTLYPNLGFYWKSPKFFEENRSPGKHQNTDEEFVFF